MGVGLFFLTLSTCLINWFFPILFQNFAWLLKVIFSTGFGLMFLTLSTCWINWFIPQDQSQWISAYRDAMSFRASHYFVSFISMATAIGEPYDSFFRKRALVKYQYSVTSRVSIVTTLP